MSESIHANSSLRVRFAPWYYIIAGDTFKNIRLGRTDLIARVAPRVAR